MQQCKGTAVIENKNCLAKSDANMADLKIVVETERRAHSDDLSLHAVTCNESDLLLKISHAECIKVVKKPKVCNIFVQVDDVTAQRIAQIDAKLISGIATAYDLPEDIVTLRYLSAVRAGKMKIRVDQASKLFIGEQLSDVQHATGRLQCRIMMDNVWIMTDCNWCGGIWRLISAKAEHTAV